MWKIALVRRAHAYLISFEKYTAGGAKIHILNFNLSVGAALGTAVLSIHRIRCWRCGLHKLPWRKRPLCCWCRSVDIFISSCILNMVNYGHKHSHTQVKKRRRRHPVLTSEEKTFLVQLMLVGGFIYNHFNDLNLLKGLSQIQSFFIL